MKIVILSTTENKGGAAIAANRLMQALQKNNIDVKMLVRDKVSDNTNVLSISNTFLDRKLNNIRFLWERFVIFCHNKFNRKNLFKVSIANTGKDVIHHPAIQEADVIHLHWINQGFLSLRGIEKLLSLGKPVVWTMHDMWPCTGVCHYAWECVYYKEECGACPLLYSKRMSDLSHKIFLKKKKLNKMPIHYVGVSTWMKKKAIESTLLKNSPVHVIPNSIDLNIFTSQDKIEMRKKYGISIDQKVIIMGAARLDDPIKGFNVFCKSLSLLKEMYSRANITIVLFGRIKKEQVLSNIPYKYIHYGEIVDMKTIVQLYSLADISVVPSFYETFGQTIIESMACDCIPISFNNGGQTDIIDHLKTGYIAQEKSPEDLAKGIMWALNNEDPAMLSEKARKKVLDTYSEDVVAKQYINLYEKILKK